LLPGTWILLLPTGTLLRLVLIHDALPHDH
jgi:hypothetical protein